MPPAVVERLLQAKKVLVIGHVPPDGDCVGSALGLARMLQALGKHADACIDDQIPGNLRRLGEPGELKRAADLASDYDLVVIVDVAANNRIGQASAAVAKAPEVLVIDHHLVDATHAELGIDPKTPLTRWVEATSDSASILVAGAIEKLAKASPKAKIDDAAWAKITLPLATGTYTDTDGFLRPGASMGALRAYKWMLETHLGGVQAKVDEVLDYKLPKLAARLLDGKLNGRSRALRTEAPELAAALRELEKSGVKMTYDLAPDGSTALLGAPRPLLEATLDLARRHDHGTTMNDVRGFLLDRLDRLPKSHALSALLFETEKGDVLLSTRSPEAGPALHLARSAAELLGGTGNGHARMAGGRPPAPLSAAEPVVRELMDLFAAERESRLRALGRF